MLIAGRFWRGPLHVLPEHARAGTLSMATSRALPAELADVIGRAKFDAIPARLTTSRERSLAEVRRPAEAIEPPPLPVCRDPDDDHVLALAIAAKVDPIISSDNDLLSPGSFEGIPISRQLRLCSTSAAAGQLSRPDLGTRRFASLEGATARLDPTSDC